MRAWKWLVALWITAVILGAFLYAREAQGFVPGAGRIIFFHVPMAMASAIGFLIAMIHAVRYLATRDPQADIRSETAAELGLLFCLLATLTGSLFAKIMWNSFWHWDPKETSILILLLIYGAYFGLRRDPRLLRRSLPDVDRAPASGLREPSPPRRAHEPGGVEHGLPYYSLQQLRRLLWPLCLAL
jgi:hypothetical protein